MSASVIAPLNLALTGPTLSAIVIA